MWARSICTSSRPTPTARSNLQSYKIYKTESAAVECTTVVRMRIKLTPELTAAINSMASDRGYPQHITAIEVHRRITATRQHPDVSLRTVQTCLSEYRRFGHAQPRQGEIAKYNSAGANSFSISRSERHAPRTAVSDAGSAATCAHTHRISAWTTAHTQIAT